MPFSRGRERSVPASQIISQVHQLRASGVKEVHLIGQNVNAYHGRTPEGAFASLAELISRVAEVPGIARIRYTTSHPGDMDASLIQAHRDHGMALESVLEGRCGIPSTIASKVSPNMNEQSTDNDHDREADHEWPIFGSDGVIKERSRRSEKHE